MKKDCPFCDKHNLDTQCIVHDNLFCVYQTHKPAVTPHLLLLPLRHVEFMEELTPEESVRLTHVLGAVIAACKDVYGIVGYNLWVNGGRQAGEEVPHFHMHFLGRRPQGNVASAQFLEKYFQNPSPMLSENEITELINKIRPTLEKRLKE